MTPSLMEVTCQLLYFESINLMGSGEPTTHYLGTDLRSERLRSEVPKKVKWYN